MQPLRRVRAIRSTLALNDLEELRLEGALAFVPALGHNGRVHGHRLQPRTFIDEDCSLRQAPNAAYLFLSGHLSGYPISLESQPPRRPRRRLHLARTQQRNLGRTRRLVLVVPTLSIAATDTPARPAKQLRAEARDGPDTCSSFGCGSAQRVPPIAPAKTMRRSSQRPRQTLMSRAYRPSRALLHHKTCRAAAGAARPQGPGRRAAQGRLRNGFVVCRGEFSFASKNRGVLTFQPWEEEAEHPVFKAASDPRAFGKQADFVLFTATDRGGGVGQETVSLMAFAWPPLIDAPQESSMRLPSPPLIDAPKLSGPPSMWFVSPPLIEDNVPPVRRCPGRR